MNKTYLKQSRWNRWLKSKCSLAFFFPSASFGSRFTACKWAVGKGTTTTTRERRTEWNICSRLFSAVHVGKAWMIRPANIIARAAESDGSELNFSQFLEHALENQHGIAVLMKNLVEIVVLQMGRLICLRFLLSRFHAAVSAAAFKSYFKCNS